MAAIGKGPGQSEVNGDLKDPRVANQPGTYKDPVSGTIHATKMSAGADAFVRMGFVRIEDEEIEPTQDAKKTLSQMNKTELSALLVEKGLNPDTFTTNDEMRKALKSA